MVAIREQGTGKTAYRHTSGRNKRNEYIEGELLSAVQADGSSKEFVDGDDAEKLAIQALVSGTVTAASVQIEQTIDDGQTWRAVGAAIDATANPAPTVIADPIGWYRVTLSGFAGAGSVTVRFRKVVPLVQ